MKKSIVVVDGSNLYYKLKELKFSNTSSFNYSKFSLHISENTKLINKYYCIGKIRADQESKKARLMMAKQQSLMTKLQKSKFIIQFGYLLKSGNRYHEKGVDVQIATNLLVGAFKNEYDTAFLVSSDSDIVPAVRECKGLEKKIVYVGFEHKPSFALMRSCSETKLLTKKDLELFMGR